MYIPIWDVDKLYILVEIYMHLLASERSERDTLSSVQLRIADIYIYYIYIVRAIFFLITHKEGGA